METVVDKIMIAPSVNKFVIPASSSHVKTAGPASADGASMAATASRSMC